MQFKSFHFLLFVLIVALAHTGECSRLRRDEGEEPGPDEPGAETEKPEAVEGVEAETEDTTEPQETVFLSWIWNTN